MHSNRMQPPSDHGRLPIEPTPEVGERISLKVMRGTKWSDGAMALRLNDVRSESEKGTILIDYHYQGGVFDTLDASHGFEFTYLPLILQDDCQIVRAESHFNLSPTEGYVVDIESRA
jgi:hypothetical protein